jgi:endonuclease/exonuclease/phosphatase family metal-dependent hydrolase
MFIVPQLRCLAPFIFFVFLCLNTGCSKNIKSFEVVAYNVQNLFDTDGISLYDDYKPDFYGETELSNKLKVICEVLRKIGGPTGPDVVLLQEIEVDRTPKGHPSATGRLISALKKEGLGPYHYKLGYDPKAPADKWPAVHCLTLSKFPITESRLHPTQMARPILETTIEVNGTAFTIFNNHWKSGASSPEMEKHRLQNATTLRTRIDELIAKDPNADFLVGGDLNSHYNQSTVYADQMKKTGINDILRSMGKEHQPGTKGNKLYNLWHELPQQERGSDAWRGNWGTLMHFLLPSTLYDDKGITYRNDSFEVAKFANLNLVTEPGIPRKWSNELDGFGASDHFPLVARFSYQGEKPQKGKGHEEIEKSLRKVDFSSAKEHALMWEPSSLDPKNYGRTFRFSGTISRNKPLTLQTKGHQLGLYSFDPKTRGILFALATGTSVSGFGHLSRYRGQWQFIVEDASWLLKI